MKKLLMPAEIPLINKYLIYLFILIIGILIGNFWHIPKKFLITSLYEKEYANLVFKCDNVMREHYISKARIASKPNNENLEKLISSELGLIDCHEYDKLRKKLMMLGLEENDLSRIGLKAIERNKTELLSIVEIHEIND